MKNLFHAHTADASNDDLLIKKCFPIYNNRSYSISNRCIKKWQAENTQPAILEASEAETDSL